MTIMLMTAGATLICEIISYLIQIIIFKGLIEILPFIKIVVIETIYNSMLIIIMYPLIEKTGNILEKVFTEKNVLTKYY
ncbi:MAG: hypothetical protein Q4G09_03330 [Clostridia bacterium]|nr:hypothetical protein [Clostridia bacterium]